MKKIVVMGLASYGAVAIVRDIKRFAETHPRSKDDKKSMFRQQHTLTITRRTWMKEFYLERYTTHTKTGWTVPSGAFDVQAEKRIRSTKDIEIGDYVKFPMPREDLYYIYKVNEWEDLSPVRHFGTDDFTDSEIKALEDALPLTEDYDPMVPKPNDIRLASSGMEFDIEGYDENGKMQKICVDYKLYSALLNATKMDYDTDFWGSVKNPRLHIEVESNETQDEVKENDTVEGDDTKEK